MQKVSEIIKKIDYRIIQYIVSFIFLYLNARGIVNWPIHVILFPLYGPILIISVGAFILGIGYNIYESIKKIIKKINKRYLKQKTKEINNDLSKTKEEVIIKKEEIKIIKEESKIDVLKNEKEKLICQTEKNIKVKRLSKRYIN